MQYEKILKSSLMVILFGLLCLAVGFMMGRSFINPYTGLSGIDKVSAQEITDTPTPIESEQTPAY